VIWSNPGNGSGVYSIVPAVPSPAGVADVFAFQGDGTVEAITSEGLTAWTADVSLAGTAVPDFEGGLVTVEWDSGSSSIVKIHGTTGQRSVLYSTESPDWIAGVVAHTDGTIFAVQATDDYWFGGRASVIGIDPATGAQKFSVPVGDEDADPEEPPHMLRDFGLGSSGQIIIAGDGYAYLPYAAQVADGIQGHLCQDHLRVLRIDSNGVSDNIPVREWTDHCHEGFGIGTATITNADTGILLSWADYQHEEGPVTGMAITAGATATQIGSPENGFGPVLQTQDGWFAGLTADGEGNPSLTVLDESGSVQWSVAGFYWPRMATEDGGVIAVDEGGAAVVFDRNGNITGTMAGLYVQSWEGNAYAYGSVVRIAAEPFALASSSAPYAGANASGNNTAVKSVPTTLVIRKAFGITPMDCYASVRNPSTGAFAQRDFTYEVRGQYRQWMPKVNIQERLIPLGGSPCPTGTTFQSGVCVANNWVPQDFLDQLSAPPMIGHSEYTQMFWVATMPNTQGYEAFYGQIKIDAYQPSPAFENSLNETLEVITVNGNTGMRPNGTPIRRCN
jgi:hypothetical protein